MENQENTFRSKYGCFPLEMHDVYHPLKTIQAFLSFQVPQIWQMNWTSHTIIQTFNETFKFWESLVWRRRIIINVLNLIESDKYIWLVLSYFLNVPSLCLLNQVSAILVCKKHSFSYYRNYCSIKDWTVWENQKMQILSSSWPWSWPWPTWSPSWPNVA